jgi:hypothetical protein
MAAERGFVVRWGQRPARRIPRGGQSPVCHARRDAPASGSPYPVAGRSPPPDRSACGGSVPGSSSLGWACAGGRASAWPGGCRAVAAVPASAPASGRRAKPVSHTLSVRAGGPGEHQPTEVGKANSGTRPGVRVKMAPLVTCAVERDTGSPKPPQLERGRRQRRSVQCGGADGEIRGLHRAHRHS